MLWSVRRRFISDTEEGYKDLLDRAGEAAADICRKHWSAVSAIADAIRNGEEVTSDHPAVAHIEYAEATALDCLAGLKERSLLHAEKS